MRVKKRLITLCETMGGQSLTADEDDFSKEYSAFCRLSLSQMALIAANSLENPCGEEFATSVVGYWVKAAKPLPAGLPAA